MIVAKEDAILVTGVATSSEAPASHGFAERTIEALRFSWGLVTRAAILPAAMVPKAGRLVYVRRVDLYGVPMSIITDPSHHGLMPLTAGIVAAYVRNHVVPGADVSKVINDVHQALATLGTGKVKLILSSEKPRPAVPIRKSVHDEYLICLEDGQRYKSLKRHLMTRYGLSPQQYREKWNLPNDYPMVAPAYAAKRSELARSTGLGQKHRKPA